MNRLAISFLVFVTLGLVVFLAFWGYMTIQSNLLSWFLLITGLVYFFGIIVVYWMRRIRFWEPQARGDVVKEERGDWSFWVITVGTITAFYLPPVEYLYFNFLPSGLWAQILGPSPVFPGSVLFIWARQTLVRFHSGYVSVSEGQPLVESRPYHFIRHPAYAGALIIALGIACGYSSGAGLVINLIISLPVPIENGIPHFIQPEALTSCNCRFAHLYDRLAWFYRAFSKIAFAFIQMDEEIGRCEITDRLPPNGGSILEVSIGPGVNRPYLMNRADMGEVFGLDISLGQLTQCQRYVAKKDWNVDLLLENGEQLPFHDEPFGGVFHVGGINFFNDKKAAIDEIIWVMKPGTRILIADETEKGAQGYEKFIPGFKKSFDGKRSVIAPSVDLVPKEMLETRVFDVWKGWLCCIEFCKP